MLWILQLVVPLFLARARAQCESLLCAQMSGACPAPHSQSSSGNPGSGIRTDSPPGFHPVFFRSMNPHRRTHRAQWASGASGRGSRVTTWIGDGESRSLTCRYRTRCFPIHGCGWPWTARIDWLTVCVINSGLCGASGDHGLRHWRYSAEHTLRAPHRAVCPHLCLPNTRSVALHSSTLLVSQTALINKWRFPQESSFLWVCECVWERNGLFHLGRRQLGLCVQDRSVCDFPQCLVLCCCLGFEWAQCVCVVRCWMERLEHTHSLSLLRFCF